MAATTVVHATFTFTLPVGATLVPWQNHTELRFERKNGKAIEEWFDETYKRFKAEITGLSNEMAVDSCPDCNGLGRSSDNKICMSCSGSGRKGFIVPGKYAEEPAPQASTTTQFTPEVLAEAQRIVEQRANPSTEVLAEAERLMKVIRNSNPGDTIPNLIDPGTE